MVKLSVVTGGVTISLEVEDLEITIEDLKKLIEEKMPEEKKISSDKQILYVKQKKLEAGKKLIEFIGEKDEGVRIFVLKETKSTLNNKNPYNDTTNPQSNQQNSQPQMPPMNNPYGHPQMNPYASPYAQPPNPYAQPNPYANPYGQPPNPYAQPPMNPYANPYAQPPMNYGQPPMNNFKLSKEMIDMVMNNPALFDQMIEMQTQGMTPEMKESFKQSTMSAFKMLQSDPSILDRINQMSGYNSPSFGSPQMGGQPFYPPMYNPYGGYPPYSPQPQSPVLTKEQYKTQYTQQMEALKDMGYNNEEENLEALIKAHGDINYALDLLRKDANFPQN